MSQTKIDLHIAGGRWEVVLPIKFKPYPKYQESGLPWIRQIPAHWTIRPVFSVFVPNQERNTGLMEQTVLSLSYGRIVIKPTEKLHGLVPKSFETYQVVNPGDIVIRTTDLQNDRTSIRVGLVRNRGIITSAYLALRTQSGVIPEFGFRYFSIWDSTKAIYGYGAGLRQSLDFSHFKRMPVPIPPPSEQAAIVRFLDYADRRIHRFIQAKQKLIKLLEEQKKVIINQAATKGLDPHVPLKDSGVEWLGPVPEHWEVLIAKRIAEVFVPQRAKPDINDTGDGFPWITLEDLEHRDIEAGRWWVTSEALQKADSKLLYPNAVIASCVGNFGTSAICRTPIVINQQLQAYQCSSLLLPEYMYFLLRIASPYFEATATTATLQYVNKQGFQNLPICLPPLLEQQAIVAFLERETASLNNAISRTKREIELLREYRTRLIADVVTGKLDVREAAANLPEEPLETDVSTDSLTDLDEEEAVEDTDEGAVE